MQALVQNHSPPPENEEGHSLAPLRVYIFAIHKNNSYNHLLVVKDDVSTNEETKMISRDKLRTVFPLNLDGNPQE